MPKDERREQARWERVIAVANAVLAVLTLWLVLRIDDKSGWEWWFAVGLFLVEVGLGSFLWVRSAKVLRG